jgi:hypothetical protein
MADTKISALTSGNPAQSGDEIPIARSGANYKITAGSIASLGGDVDGPASSTDNAVARFDSTTGKLIQNSGVTIDDSNNLTLPGQADLRFADSDSSNWVAFQAPSTVASNVTWTLPNADGTSGQVLSTDGSGTLSWATGGGGGGSPGGSNTQVQYNNSGSFGGITNATTDGTTLSMTSPKVITGINDTNGNELLKVTATASAVNELTLANAATGSNPVLSATGGDTNIGITLTPKGTGGVVFPAGAVGTPAITTTGDTNTGVYFPGSDSVAITTGGTAAITVDSGQRTKFPTTIGIGNATPSTSGSGITFPATQSASTDVNTLDDYEEGTWTPTIIGSTTSGTATYPAERDGKYTKIGNVVYISSNVAWNSGTGTGNLRVSGLPFTSANVANIFPAITIAFSDNVAGTANNIQTASIRPNNTIVQIEQYPVGGGTATGLGYDAAGQLSFGGFYFV